MPSKYPVLKPSEIIRVLEKYGFKFVKQKGSHIKYSNGWKIVIIPNHSEIAKGTLKSILKQANIDLDDFLNNLLIKNSPIRVSFYLLSSYIFINMHIV